MVFETVILSVMEFYGAEWRQMQIAELAEMMHHDYYWLHLAELKLFSLKAKKGEFNIKESFAKPVMPMDAPGNRAPYQGTEEYDGKIYGELKPAVLLKWIQRYADESLYQRGTLRLEQQPAQQKMIEESDETKGFIGPDRAVELLKEFASTLVQPSDLTDAEKEEIYRLEKIKQRQRDAMRNNENPQP